MIIRVCRGNIYLGQLPDRVCCLEHIVANAMALEKRMEINLSFDCKKTGGKAQICLSDPRFGVGF